MVCSSWLFRLRNVECVRDFIRVLNYSQSYSETVLLPKTSFPMVPNGVKKSKHEESIREKAKFDELYSWQWEHNTGKLFILHDGPPYANGRTHCGHVINKVLKDAINRYNILRGRKVHYVPGWDCHGLPIELKAISGSSKPQGIPPLEIREKAHQFAKDTIEVQKKAFKSWGIMADWDRPYTTFDSKYVVEELRAFYQLYNKGLIYRGYRPVYWSPSTRTGLAESELEYNQSHKSLSVYVKFKILKFSDIIKQIIGSEDVYALAWTTTPWSLPANQAIAYKSSHEYCIVRHLGVKELYLIAKETVSQLNKVFNTELQVLGTFEGTHLKDAKYKPLFSSENELPFLDGPFVTLDKGTGLVHSAPNHGFEDYNLFQQYKIPLNECLVDEDGLFVEKAGQQLAGKNVLSDGNLAVIALLGSNVLHQETYIHSYPYDWRSKKPVVIRGSQQWFIDTNKLQEQCQSALESVKMMPPYTAEVLKNRLQNRPHWCISRQRSWGVPIPVFYHQSSNMHLVTKESIEHLCQLIDTKGPDCWWTCSVETLFPDEVRKKCNIPADEPYVKGEDILDIWFDSGISWLINIPDSSEGFKVADAYLEGTDQLRGWFQSSLLTSIALQGRAPYRSADDTMLGCIYVHGFAVDENLRKMSKSLGNVVDPEIIIEGGKNLKKNPSYGVDVLRWWVACHASDHENVPVADSFFKESAQNVFKIRNTLRFLLGNLYEFDEQSQQFCSLQEMQLLDQYILHQLYHFSVKTISAYEELNISQVVKNIIDLVYNDVALYCILIKDRMYCENRDSVKRTSCQASISFLLQVLVQFVAPILPHLAEEVYVHHPQPEKRQHGAFRSQWFKCPAEWNQPELAKVVDIVREIRFPIVADKGEEHMHKYSAKLLVTADILHCLKQLQSEPTSCTSTLCELMHVSEVTLVENIGDDVVHDGCYNIFFPSSGSKSKVTVILTSPKLKFCPRCRRYASQDMDTLCERCQTVVR